MLRVLELHNIRSYQDAIIEFPNGLFLLSGEIGSGKTTVLLAVEFAFFGLLRGTISGSDLLRHGTNDGSVKLEFEIDQKKYTVFRALKRTSSGISQDYGYIELDGVKENLTHTELKSRILDLLGFPKSLLSKSKDLIFRYTTFTPQEEVKKIMYENTETRLNTLRKIFNLDKYKIAKDNSQNLIRSVKQSKEIISQKIEGEDEIDQEIISLKSLIIKHENMLSENEEIIHQQKNNIEELNKKLLLEEKKIEEYRNIKQKNELFKQKENQLKQNIILIEEQLKNNPLGDKPEKIKVDELIIKKNELQIKFEEIQEKLQSAKLKELNAKKSIQLIKEENNIEDISICPTCKQEVCVEHKNKIKLLIEEKVRDYEDKINIINNYKIKAEENIKKIKPRIELLNEQINNAKIQEQKIKQYEEKKIFNENLHKKLNIIAEELINIQKELSSLIIPIFNEEDYKELKNKIVKVQEDYNENRIALTALKTEIKHQNNNLSILKKKVEETKKYREEIKKLNITGNWLEKYFINSLSAIEKNVMLKIHAEFNASFQDWFETLISDDTITARLDETFTPYIIQNGERTNFENLSGGEKTSMALSYRLALNRVISDFMTGVKTKDLLILDEPTDGFSANQLDKIRDVLEKIPSKQIILVSHEPKLESFVEEIIRVHKTGHVSNTA